MSLEDWQLPYSFGITCVLALNSRYSNGSAHRFKDNVVFSLDLPDGTAWRGKFLKAKDEIRLVGNSVGFESEGKFEALKNSPLTATCESLSKFSSSGKE